MNLCNYVLIISVIFGEIYLLYIQILEDKYYNSFYRKIKVNKIVIKNNKVIILNEGGYKIVIFKESLKSSLYFKGKRIKSILIFGEYSLMDNLEYIKKNPKIIETKYWIDDSETVKKILIKIKK